MLLHFGFNKLYSSHFSLASPLKYRFFHFTHGCLMLTWKRRHPSASSWRGFSSKWGRMVFFESVIPFFPKPQNGLGRIWEFWLLLESFMEALLPSHKKISRRW